MMRPIHRIYDAWQNADTKRLAAFILVVAVSLFAAGQVRQTIITRHLTKVEHQLQVVQHQLKVEHVIVTRPGIPGPRGAQGPRGRSGVEGPRGLTGATGKRGNTGLRGIPGSMGPQGLRGLQGPAGPPGLRGLQGLPGLPGISVIISPAEIQRLDNEIAQLQSILCTKLHLC